MDNIESNDVEMLDTNTDNDGSSSSSSDGSSEESSNSSDSSLSSDSKSEMSFIFVSEVLCRSYFYPKRPMHTSRLQGKDWLGELLAGHPDRIVNSLRMNKRCFIAFSNFVAQRGLLKSGQSTRVGIRESIAIFLVAVGFSTRQRTMCERFQHSIKTISRHVKRVAKALNRLAAELIHPPDFEIVHPKILNDPRLHPYFKDCVGAIDGSLVDAWVPASKHNAYRSRKGQLSQNIMDVCDFDLMFTYILAGWEGSANDARVLLHALTTDKKFPWPPEGKYYLVDSGYSCFPGFLTLYRQHTYHINAWRAAQRECRGPEELFNRYHSRLRNAIERAFGVLKGRFPILKSMLRYSLKRQAEIVIACCVVHNFIRKYFNDDDELFLQADNGEFDPTESDDEEEQQHPQTTQDDINQMTCFRDALAAAMWADR